MFEKVFCVIFYSFCVFFLIFLLVFGESCATFDDTLNKSAKVVNGFVKVHDVVQEGVSDIQQFCADMYIELQGNPRAQKRLVDFCNRADRVSDEIQRIEKEFLKDSIKQK